jgi:signal transduction histidine kinase
MGPTHAAPRLPDRLTPVLKLVGFASLLQSINSTTRLGGSGWPLVALVLTGAVAAAGLAIVVVHPERRAHLPLGLGAALLLALSGGALSALTPAGSIALGVAGLFAARLLDLPAAALVTGCGLLAALVTGLARGVSAGELAGAAAGALLGLVVGLRRRQLELRARQEEALAVAEQRSEVEHGRAEVLAERNRIAREVHDVLAHTLSALSVQLTALDSLVDDDEVDAAAVRAALGRSRALVVDGLTETRRAVGTLRDEPVALAEQLARLADGGGVQVTGAVRPLPAPAGHALLRVAQEALTNARRHAPGAPVQLRLAFTDTGTTVTVTNPVPATAAPEAGGSPEAGGYGLRGMRERVELLGGTLTAGADGGCWQVEAEVPG